jgi:hypothetical protein
MARFFLERAKPSENEPKKPERVEKERGNERKMGEIREAEMKNT